MPRLKKEDYLPKTELVKRCVELGVTRKEIAAHLQISYTSLCKKFGGFDPLHPVENVLIEEYLNKIQSQRGLRETR